MNWNDNIARGIEALSYLKTQIAGYQGSKFLKPKVIQNGAVLPSNLKHVPESIGRDKRGSRQTVLNNCIGGNSRTMN